MGSQGVGHDWVTNTFTFKLSIVNRSDTDPKAAKIGSWGQRKLTQWLGTAQKVPVQKYTVCNLCSATRSCLILWDPMDCGLSGFSLHWISQARILVWVVISCSRGSSSLRDQTQVFCISCIGRHFFFFFLNHWATSKALLTGQFVCSINISFGWGVSKNGDNWQKIEKHYKTGLRFRKHFQKFRRSIQLCLKFIFFSEKANEIKCF